MVQSAKFALVFILCILVQSNVLGGFILIDEFTDPNNSDGHGNRTTSGRVEFEEFGIALGAASAISGVEAYGEVASIFYSFLPTPLAVKPIVLVTAKNNQTTYEESGILEVSVNGLKGKSRLLNSQREYSIYSFDFSDRIKDDIISSLRIDWIRPADATGARELLIDSIAVADVPEPATISLIFLAALTKLRSVLKFIRRGKPQFLSSKP